VVDIAEALRNSLASLKKPAVSAEKPGKPEQSAPRRPKKLSRGAGRNLG